MRSGSATTAPPCPTCAGTDQVRVPTYKRIWNLCRSCGTGHPQQRERYPLERLPGDAFKRQAELDDESIYDYFTSPETIAHSKGEAGEFLEEVVEGHGIAVEGRRVLDISGGNGQVAAAVRDAGAEVTLTEINEPAIRYARESLGLDAVHYRFEDGPLAPHVTGRYDIVLARACIMFCEDLPGFLRACREVLNDGGLVVIDRSVKPTLGVLLRVQLDEFSYSILRQPETVVGACEDAGFSVEARVDEIDADMYVYDHDLTRDWSFLHYLYEIPAARRLRGDRTFDFPARDRRRSRIVARVA